MLKKILLSIVTVSVLGGCTTIPQVESSSKEATQIKSFSASKDNAVIYLYRDKKSDYGLFELPITIGDDDVMTYSSCYRRIELSPGDWEIEADNPDVFGFEDELTFKATPGKVSFYEYKPIAHFVTPGETKILEKTKEDAISVITTQKLCINPLVKLSKK